MPEVFFSTIINFVKLFQENKIFLYGTSFVTKNKIVHQMKFSRVYQISMLTTVVLLLSFVPANKKRSAIKKAAKKVVKKKAPAKKKAAKKSSKK